MIEFIREVAPLISMLMQYFIYLVIIVILVCFYMLYRNIKDVRETLEEVVKSSLRGEEVIVSPGFGKPMGSAILINISVFILAILTLALNPSMFFLIPNILIFWVILAPYWFTSFFTSKYLYSFPIEEMRSLMGIFLSMVSNLPSLTLYLIFAYFYSWPLLELFIYFTIFSYILTVFLSIRLKRGLDKYKNEKEI
ncbi:MAG: hypothetical protein ACTSR0_00520 [Candidatus Asgardarchaeia archaeon]